MSNSQKPSGSRALLKRRAILKFGSTAALLGLSGRIATAAEHAAPKSEMPRSVTPGSTLIRNVHLLSMDNSIGELPAADILIRNGRFVAVGRNLKMEADEVVDGTGKIALPGFVDGHRHLWQTPMRGAGGGWSFNQYIRDMLYTRAVCYDPEDMYVAGLAGGLEALNAGITSVVDHSHNMRSPEHADGAAEGMIASGVGGIFGYCYGRTPTHGPGATTTSDEILTQLSQGKQWRFKDAVRVRDKYFSSPDSLVRFGIATSFFETFARARPEEAIEEMLEARKVRASLIMQHVRARGDFRVVRFLDENNLLGPDLMLSHADWVTVPEFEVLAKNGVKIIVTPETELKGGNFPALSRGQSAGMDVGLGMDTVIMVGGDMFGPMRMMQQIQRYRKYAPSPTPQPYEVQELTDIDILQAATIGGARALGIDDRVGSVAPGKQADLQLVDARELQMLPLNNAAATIVHHAHVGTIESVWVAGRQVKKNGTLTHVDVSEVAKQLVASRDNILERAKTVSVDGEVDLYQESKA